VSQAFNMKPNVSQTDNNKDQNQLRAYYRSRERPVDEENKLEGFIYSIPHFKSDRDQPLTYCNCQKRLTNEFHKLERAVSASNQKEPPVLLAITKNDEQVFLKGKQGDEVEPSNTVNSLKNKESSISKQNRTLSPDDFDSAGILFKGKQKEKKDSISTNIQCQQRQYHRRNRIRVKKVSFISPEGGEFRLR